VLPTLATSVLRAQAQLDRFYQVVESFIVAVVLNQQVYKGAVSKALKAIWKNLLLGQV
jgi:hypothetical protein